MILSDRIRRESGQRKMLEGVEKTKQKVKKTAATKSPEKAWEFVFGKFLKGLFLSPPLKMDHDAKIRF